MLPGTVNPVRPLSWLAVGSKVPADPMDVLVTVDAEDVFDVEADPPRITVPTLVIGGAKDPFYSRELFEGTAARVQDGRVHIFPSWGHGRAAHVRSHHSPHPWVHALRAYRSRRSLTEGGHAPGGCARMVLARC